MVTGGPNTTLRRQPACVSRAIGLDRLARGLWAVVIVMIAVRVAFSPHRNSVFDVFRAAGSRWLAADELYPRAGEFLYSPLAAAFFAPFARLPEALGGILWRLGTALPYFLIADFWLGRNYPESDRARGVGLLLLLALSVGNLNNGQASPLILALLCAALIAAGSERWDLAALCITVAAFFKLYPLAFGLLLAALYPRKLAWRLAVMVGALFFLSLLLQKPGYALAQYRSWFVCLGADHRRLADGVGHWRDVWLLLRLAGIPISVSQYAAVQVASGVALACFCLWAQRVKRWAADRLLLGILALGACWVVLFGPSTELATYVFLAPAFAVAGAGVFGNANGPKPIGPVQALLLGSFIWLATAELLNAWVPSLRRSLPLHALQPIGALGFCASVLAWLLDDGWWRSRISPSPPANGFLQRP
jgi:hypothetical protein